MQEAVCVAARRPVPERRLARVEAAEGANQRTGCALGDSEPASLPLREGRDGEVRVHLEKRPEVAFEIRVAEQQSPRRRFLLAKGQRLALAEARAADDPGTGPLSRCAGAVP